MFKLLKYSFLNILKSVISFFQLLFLKQIEFYKTHLENLKLQSTKLETDIRQLKNDQHRNLRDGVFKEILLKPKPM